MYHCPARQATLNTGLPWVLKNSPFMCKQFKTIKSFKYIPWYKKSLNYNLKRAYSCGRKDKNRDSAGLNFKRQWCHWINMSVAHFKVKTRHSVFMWMCLWRAPSVLRNILLVFSFHLAYKMPDKAAYMSTAWCWFVYSRYRRSRYLLLKHHLMAENEFAFLMFRSMRISTHIFMQQT